MPGRTESNRKPKEPRYVPWRGRLIAELALTRAGLLVQEVPEPFDVLASTPDGFYFLLKVTAYSSMHGGHGAGFDGSSDTYPWPVEPPVLRAAEDVNLPVVLFVIDADREVAYYARLDRLPRRDQRTNATLTADRDLSPAALADLVSELRQDWAASRRPA